MSRRWIVSALVVACVAWAIAVWPSSHADAQQRWEYTLAAGQAVTAGNYTVHFLGVFRNFPTYDLYAGTSWVARFPSDPPPANSSEYVYGNVRIATTAVSADRSTVSGSITLK